MVAAILFIVAFSIGPGAIPWLITSELFKSDARGKATSIAVFVNWGSNTLVTFLFPIIEVIFFIIFLYIQNSCKLNFIFIIYNLKRAIGNYSFIIFGILLIIFGIFLVIFVPETKNKSSEQIYDEFENRVFFIGIN